MPTYRVHVNFCFETDVDVDAPDAATAQAMVETATHDQISHLNGKAYATVNEATREVTSVTEV